MSTMISEVYDALIDAGAGEAKARKAAEVLADYDSRFNRIEGGLTLLKWMVGANVTLTMVLLGSAFAVWSKLGEITGQLARMGG